jgi:hypothetical protein
VRGRRLTYSRQRLSLVVLAPFAVQPRGTTAATECTRPLSTTSMRIRSTRLGRACFVLYLSLATGRTILREPWRTWQESGHCAAGVTGI